jgi:hypothetical protein
MPVKMRKTLENGRLQLIGAAFPTQKERSKPVLAHAAPPSRRSETATGQAGTRREGPEGIPGCADTLHRRSGAVTEHAGAPRERPKAVPGHAASHFDRSEHIPGHAGMVSGRSKFVCGYGGEGDVRRNSAECVGQTARLVKTDRIAANASEEI